MLTERMQMEHWGYENQDSMTAYKKFITKFRKDREDAFIPQARQVQSGLNQKFKAEVNRRKNLDYTREEQESFTVRQEHKCYCNL